MHEPFVVAPASRLRRGSRLVVVALALLAVVACVEYGGPRVLAGALLSPVSQGARAPSRRDVLLGGASSAALLLPRAAQAASPVYTLPPGSLAGQTVLITGANTGLGLESAKRLAVAGANLIVTARSEAKAAGAADDVKDAARSAGAQAGRITPLELDLASLQDIQSFPARLEAALGRNVNIDVLLNNAGVMAIPERLTTADGFERTLGVNHLGHFALTAGLLPAMKRSANGFRVVTVSSDAHRFVTPDVMKAAIDADLDPAYTAWGNYGLSKAANVLFTLELQRRIAEAGLRASAVALHPGVVQTDLARYILGGVDAGDVRLSETAAPPEGIGKLAKKALDAVIIPPDLGANTQVYLAAAADAGGDRARPPAALYFDKMSPTPANAAATDPTLARALWDVSERLTSTRMII